MSRGFTLLEVLIALAIIALGLAAAVRASGEVAAGAEQAKLRMLALWVAEDRLAGQRGRRSLPAAGVAEGSVAQAGVDFVWREHATAMPDPALRAIEITVSAAAQPDYVLARLRSVLSAPAP